MIHINHKSHSTKDIAVEKKLAIRRFSLMNKNSKNLSKGVNQAIVKLAGIADLFTNIKNETQNNVQFSESMNELSVIMQQDETLAPLDDSIDYDFLKIEAPQMNCSIVEPGQQVIASIDESIHIRSAISFVPGQSILGTLEDLDLEEENSSDDLIATFLSTKPTLFSLENVPNGKIASEKQYDFSAFISDGCGSFAHDLTIFFEDISPLNAANADDTIHQNCYSFANDMMHVKNVFFPNVGKKSANETFDNSSSQINSPVIVNAPNNCKPDGDEDELFTDISIEFADVSFKEEKYNGASSMNENGMILFEIEREDNIIS